MKTFERIERNPNLSGLVVYEIPNVWQISKDKKSFCFATIGITISGSWYGSNQDYTERYQKTFAGEVSYDYRDPENADTYGVFTSGTRGQMFFNKSLDGMIEEMEKFMNSRFEGLCSRNNELNTYQAKDVNYKTVKPEQKYSRLELAKLAYLHNTAIFHNQFDKEPDFRMRLMQNIGGEDYARYLYMCSKYDNRNRADEKYQKKLNAVFNRTFEFSIDKCVSRFCFYLRDFERHLGIKIPSGKHLKDVLSPEEVKVITKCIKYYRL